MTEVYPNLHGYFNCISASSSLCCCQDLLLELISFFLQSSPLIQDLLSLARECKSLKDADKFKIYQTLDENDCLLEILCSFVRTSEKLNNELIDYIKSIVGLDFSEMLVHDERTFSEIQFTVTSVLYSFGLESLLSPLLNAYLCLELESAEISEETLNVFSSIMCYNSTSKKTQIIMSTRKLSQADHLINWSFFYKSLCVPFIIEALTYRTKLLCSENYSEQFLDSIIKYKNCILNKVLLPRIFSKEEDLLEVTSQLSDIIVYKTFYNVHKPELFSLVIEYPDSVSTLMDLGKCLDHLPVRQDLINHLTEEVQHRLLHPGVHTEQILVAYSYLVRALRLIDSTFLVQDVVCKPVSACLRQREDAVRCIVDKLISGPDSEAGDDEMKIDEYADTTTELHQELLLPKPLEVEPLDAGEDSDADIVSEDPPFDWDSQNSNNQTAWGSDWKPDPVEALCQKGHWRRRLDLLSMLVSIYGSKKAFLVEYKQLLSQRLLRQRSFHTAKELKNLELLKLRFGEQNLHECEVMLKDIRDSKRIANLVSESDHSVIDSNLIENEPTEYKNSPSSKNHGKNKENLIQTTTASTVTSTTTVVSTVTNTNSLVNHANINDEIPIGKQFTLSAYILSMHYWPELLDEKFKLPSVFQPTFDHYERCFQRLKGNRTLNWMHKLGLVNIDLKLGDQNMQLDVTPLQASIAYLFTKQRTWSLKDLVQELESQISHVRSGLNLFIQLGFIRFNDFRSDCQLEPNFGDRNEIVNEIYEICDPEECTDSFTARNDSTSLQTNRGQSDPSQNTWIYSGQDLFDPDLLVSNVRERKEKELQVFWSYIVAMLTNLGSLSLDRIHSMLRMFALGSTSSIECSRDELRRFLDQKIRDGQLVCDGDMYKLVSSDN